MDGWNFYKKKLDYNLILKNKKEILLEFFFMLSIFILVVW